MEVTMEQNTYNPAWWSADDDSSWSSAREDVRRELASPQSEWDAIEPALRYGFGAFRHYSARSAFEDIDRDLEQAWEQLKSGHSWADVRPLVERGWQAAKNKATQQ
jgi:hypothetical protein